MANLVITSCRCSVWRKDGKQLRLFSNGNDREKVKKFYVVGYNPFPCYFMNSTFHIVAEWLKANGWERQPGGFVTTREEFTDSITGEKYISTRVTRFVPQ